ncbi:MAG: diguanylate cyclase, partial [Planctomycetota bacterium]
MNALSAPPPLAPELASQNRGRGETADAETAPPPTRPTDSPRLLMDLVDLRPPGGTPAGLPISAICRNALVDALRHRDHRTLTHSHRAAWLAGGVARGLGVGGSALAVVETAALLHDVGKIGVPDNILYKPGPLAQDEAELMDLHRGVGSAVLQACGASDDLLEVVARVGADGDDGFGTDRSEVHDLPGRIVSLCEAYDSLRTDQPYRDGYPHEAALRALSGRTEHRYDPTILDNLDRWVKSQGEASALDKLLEPAEKTDPAAALRAVRFCHIFGYLSLLETLYEGFCLMDADLRCTVWSPGLEDLLGRRFAEMRGEIRTGRTLEFASPNGEPLADQARPLDRVLTTGRPVAETAKVRRSARVPTYGASEDAEEWVDVEVQVFPLTDPTGSVRGVAEIYRNLNRQQRRPREFRELRRAATRDALTGVANRGELESRLARALRESQEENRGLAVMFLDLDHFKTVNDTWGHGVGDEVLKHLTSLLKAECYSGETVGRYGGEEFVVICPQTDLKAAADRADRLRRVISETKVNGRSQPRPTASFGVAAAEPGDTVETLVQRADAALYQSKATGRNKVTSLTEAERQDVADPAAAEKRARLAESKTAFRLEQTVQACLAASMVVHKMRGFLEDHAAKVLSVTDNEICFKLGDAGLIQKWGRRRDECPVRVDVKVGAELITNRTAAMLNDVTIVIEPVGWGVKRDLWQERSGQVARDLKA